MSDDWQAVGAEAARRLREHRAAEAASLFERLTELRPDDANVWYNLGYARRMARRYEEALEAYAEALARGVARPEDVHLNRAVILSEHLHRADEAAEELRKAVAANPRFTAAWLNLGNLYEDFGEAEAARDAYRKALGADPGSGRAIARLAAIDVHEGKAGEAIGQLKIAAGQPSSRPQDAAEMLFALGNALDAAGEYSEAFQAIAQANLAAASARPPALRYDPAAQERLVDALIAMPPLASAGAFPVERAPIFICGMFRSGSTLVEQLLSRHPRITAGGELEFVPALVLEDLQPYPDALAQASAERLAELRDKYLDQVCNLFPHADRVTDKRPDNFLHIGLIKALFPEAHVVHTVRQPLDNILSVFFLYFGESIRYSERLDDIVHHYVQYRRLMDHWFERFPGDIHEVDYDALVSDPRGELEPLLIFCGLEWDDAVLSQGRAEAVRTASNWQVRKPLHARSSGRWKNYVRELEPVRQQLIGAGLLSEDA